jgi:hypothetical protein
MPVSHAMHEMANHDADAPTAGDAGRVCATGGEEDGGEEGGWSGVATAAAAKAMVMAGRGPCQANRGHDAVGNVVLCGKANRHCG